MDDDYSTLGIEVTLSYKENSFENEIDETEN